MKLKRIAKAVALIAGPVGFMLVCVLVIHALYLRASDRAILEDLGVAGPGDLQMAVITEGIDLYGPGRRTYLIHDRKTLTEFYRRLTDPEAVWPANGSYRYALILKDDRIVLFNEDSARDLTRRKREIIHPKILWTQELLDHPVRHTLPQIIPARILIYKLSSKGRVAMGDMQLDSKDDKRMQRICSVIQALVNQYDPYAVQPTSRQPVKQLMETWQSWKTTVFEIELASPVSFMALVLPSDVAAGWGNDAPDTGGRLEALRADTVLISASDWEVMLAFRSENKPDCVTTCSLPSKQIKGYCKDGERILGEDLVKELVRLTIAP